MTETAGGADPWVFGLEPPPQGRVAAPLLRRVNELIQALEWPDPAVDRLIDDLRAAEAALAGRVGTDPVPRVGEHADPEARPYTDHGRDVGAFNACFPEYELVVTDAGAAGGTVTFPIAFEGPPGLVHGGMLATFFDAVVQQHNCEVGQAGRTTSLDVRYRRPTPLGVPLAVLIERVVADGRITSTAVLTRDGEVLCSATVTAAVGDRSALPIVWPRREVR